MSQTVRSGNFSRSTGTLFSAFSVKNIACVVMLLAQRFDLLARERYSRHPAKNLQQHPDALDSGHPGIDRKLSAERSREDFDAVTCLQLTARYLDRPVMLTAPYLFDDGVGNLGRMEAVHHEADNARTPSRRVPLQTHEQEGISRKKRKLTL